MKHLQCLVKSFKVRPEILVDRTVPLVKNKKMNLPYPANIPLFMAVHAGIYSADSKHANPLCLKVVKCVKWPFIVTVLTVTLK